MSTGCRSATPKVKDRSLRWRRTEERSKVGFRQPKGLLSEILKAPSNSLQRSVIPGQASSFAVTSGPRPSFEL